MSGGGRVGSVVSEVICGVVMLFHDLISAFLAVLWSMFKWQSF